MISWRLSSRFLAKYWGVSSGTQGFTAQKVVAARKTPNHTNRYATRSSQEAIIELKTATLDPIAHALDPIPLPHIAFVWWSGLILTPSTQRYCKWHLLFRYSYILCACFIFPMRAARHYPITVIFTHCCYCYSCMHMASVIKGVDTKKCFWTGVNETKERIALERPRRRWEY